MPINFAVKIVRLKICINVCQFDDLTFTQGHNYISNLSRFYLWFNSNISDNIQAMAFKLGMVVDIFMAYVLMLMMTTFTLIEGVSCLAD